MTSPAAFRPAPQPPSELLYDLVALGMWLYTHVAFRITVLGTFRIEPGQLLVATHRRNADVPLLCAAVFFRGGIWRQHRVRLHFAARDDLFEPGALAALTPGLPLALRRRLFAVDPAPLLRRVRVHPLRSSASMRLGQALRTLPPGTPLPGALAAGLASERPGPELVDRLWRPVSLEEMPLPPLWQAWTTAAGADLRELVALLRAGQPLLLFPEGTPSRDGAIGPLRRGLSVLVRKGRPARLVPLALAYDPLTSGRPRACLGIGAPLPAPVRDVEASVLAALRRAMPLTCGQVAASELRARGSLTFNDLDAALAEAVATEGRPADPLLADPDSRRRLAAECVAALAGLDPDDELVARLARERESANA
jgi:1-acyl-sn-glycerol-3-phosphate acyltransferase